jgi:hypothetical protein
MWGRCSPAHSAGVSQLRQLLPEHGERTGGHQRDAARHDPLQQDAGTGEGEARDAASGRAPVAPERHRTIGTLVSPFEAARPRPRSSQFVNGRGAAQAAARPGDPARFAYAPNAKHWRGPRAGHRPDGKGVDAGGSYAADADRRSGRDDASLDASAVLRQDLASCHAADRPGGLVPRFALQRPLASSRGGRTWMFCKEQRRGWGAGGPSAGRQAPHASFDAAARRVRPPQQKPRGAGVLEPAERSAWPLCL